MIVTVTPTFGAVQEPNGTTNGPVRYRILFPNGTVAASQDVADPQPATVDLSVASAGSYTLSIQRLDANQFPLGAAFTAPLTVSPPPPVTIQIPTGATTTVA